MTNQTPIEEADGYLEARRGHYAMLRQEDTHPIDTIWGKPLTARTVHCLLEQIRLNEQRLTEVRRQLDAADAQPAVEVWLMDNERTRIHDTELGAKAAAVSSWVDDNPDPGYAAAFAWTTDPDWDNCLELVAEGRRTGIYVTRMPVETSDPEPNPLEAAVTEALADIAVDQADPGPAPADPPWLIPAGDD